MSSYGVKSFTPEEEKEQWREHVEREAKATRGRRTRRCGRSPLEEESTQSYNPVSYFGNGKEHQKATTYDKLVHIYKGVDYFLSAPLCWPLVVAVGKMMCTVHSHAQQRQQYMTTSKVV